jgi:hypothetical protein
MDEKLTYLYSFEAVIRELVGIEGMQQFSTGLRDGMWCNAHMYHGMGLDCELAAVKFFTEVIVRYHYHLLAA